MKKLTFIIALMWSTGLTYSQDRLTPDDSLSYALGQDLGGYLKRMEMPINKQKLLQAIDDVLDTDKKPLFETEQKEQIIRAGMQRLQEKKNAALKQTAVDFMEENRAKPNIETTPEGIQYEVLQSGSGEKANIEDTVVVHYVGKLATGETFDDSYDRGEPVSLTLEKVIEGWKIGIPMMNTGSKYRFFIPYHLGYGERGSGPIPPFSALVFDVELLEIKKLKIEENEV